MEEPKKFVSDIEMESPKGSSEVIFTIRYYEVHREDLLLEVDPKELPEESISLLFLPGHIQDIQEFCDKFFLKPGHEDENRLDR